MSQQIKDDIFKLRMTPPLSKAEKTDEAVRSILKMEADAHDALTRRLRDARLARDAETPQPAPTKTRKRTKPKA